MKATIRFVQLADAVEATRGCRGDEGATLGVRHEASPGAGLPPG